MRYKVKVVDNDTKETFLIPETGSGIENKEVVQKAADRWKLNFPADSAEVVEVGE